MRSPRSTTLVAALLSLQLVAILPAQARVPQPKAPLPKAPQPKAPQPETSQPGVSHPGAAQPWVPKPRVTQTELSRLWRRIVLLRRRDGTWLVAQILRVTPTTVTVRLSDGLNAKLPLATLTAVRQHLPQGPPPRTTSGTSAGTSATTTTTATQEPSPKPPHKLRVEWVGMRAGIGGVAWTLDEGSLAGFGELMLFTLHYRHFYWEILRVGGGNPHLIHWGTALGYPFHLDDNERHQLRLGLHISFWYGLNPALSGLQLYYVYRSPVGLAIQVGIMQTSYPFSVTAIVGISM